ncbi:MFS transporter [Klugiella xanthotipulae]|uniref:CP family cyanate transporter-like MFS transporter n=1 Tax=Klugiella xanthotipulae TaxID=244735 RepID=A0A543I4L5_9MICO|nr:MFS transporter [Klugiella xanthotipulae]TQM65507.1 CP family cyanate transporter-like MFS transporter [Klugiella xanthotipulae]
MTPSPLPVTSRFGKFFVLVAILLMSVNLRSAVASMSPVFVFINEDIPLNSAVKAVIGMMPPILFAVCGVLTPMLVRRTSLEVATIIALSIQVTGLLMRAVTPDTTWLIIGSACAMGGMGMGNVLLPPLIKRHFPQRIAVMTTVYVTLISVGTFVPAFLAVPIASAAGWRVSMGIWCSLAAVVIIPWLVVAFQQRSQGIRLGSPMAGEPEPGVAATDRPAGRVWTSRVAWAVTVVFTLSSMNAYSMFSWLPVILQDSAGVSAAEAGSLMGLYAFMGLPAALLVPALASRLGSVSKLIYFAIACGLVGYAGLWVMPGTLTWLWVVIAGLGPTLFPIALLMINRRTRSHRTAVTLSGFAQSVGYTVAAIGPLGVGLLHDLTGGWGAGYAVLCVFFLGGIWAARVLRTPQTVEEDWASRPHSAP